MQKVIMKSKTNCSICDEPYEGYGHLAHPINDGYCCDECHKLVMLARFKAGKGFMEDI